MHTDKAIAEFEAWWDSQPHREQFEDVKDQMRNVWAASWAESRAQIVIELPDAYANCPPYACYEGGWNDMRDEAVDRLEAAGVTVRG